MKKWSEQPPELTWMTRTMQSKKSRLRKSWEKLKVLQHKEVLMRERPAWATKCFFAGG